MSENKSTFENNHNKIISRTTDKLALEKCSRSKMATLENHVAKRHFLGMLSYTSRPYYYIDQKHFLRHKKRKKRPKIMHYDLTVTKIYV